MSDVIGMMKSPSRPDLWGSVKQTTVIGVAEENHELSQRRQRLRGQNSFKVWRGILGCHLAPPSDPVNTVAGWEPTLLLFTKPPPLSLHGEGGAKKKASNAFLAAHHDGSLGGEARNGSHNILSVKTDERLGGKSRVCMEKEVSPAVTRWGPEENHLCPGGWDS